MSNVIDASELFHKPAPVYVDFSRKQDHWDMILETELVNIQMLLTEYEEKLIQSMTQKERIQARLDFATRIQELTL